MAHPLAVTPCNMDMEGLINDGNRSIATLAITTLLKTGSESGVERLMKQITSFMSEIAGAPRHRHPRPHPPPHPHLHPHLHPSPSPSSLNPKPHPPPLTFLPLTLQTSSRSSWSMPSAPCASSSRRSTGCS